MVMKMYELQRQLTFILFFDIIKPINYSKTTEYTDKRRYIQIDFWVYRLFYFAMIGGVEHGESTGSGKHN